MLVSALEEERQKLFQSGLREGEQKGKIDTAKAMLAKGMELPFISEITRLPESQLVDLRDELSSMKK